MLHFCTDSRPLPRWFAHYVRSSTCGERGIHSYIFDDQDFIYFGRAVGVPLNDLNRSVTLSMASGHGSEKIRYSSLRRSGTPILLRSSICPEACRFGSHIGDFPFHSSTLLCPASAPVPVVFHQEHQAQSLSFAAAEMVGAPESLLICLRLDDFSEALKIGVNILLSLLIIVL